MEADFLKNKKVLVTGGNGFVGSHMVNKLVNEGCNVYVIARESSDMWRLDEVKDDIHILVLDIRNSEAINSWMSKTSPDFVFHMAAYGVDSRQKDYITAAETNIIGTINIVQAAASAGCEKLLNVGTSMQYGNKNGAISEADYYNPTNIYGSTKGASTIIAHQIARENSLDIVTIIPFGVFGEKEGSHKFFPHVILSALLKDEIQLSPCDQYRDYCYIENIIDGFIMAAGNKNIKNEIYNIGSGKVFQLKYYVDLIMERLNGSKKVNYGAIDYRKNDLWSPLPDISKISSQLGWTPEISLEEGVDRTIGWFSSNYEKYTLRGR